MVPVLAAAAIVTFAAVLSLYLMVRSTWLQNRRFQFLSLFFGLDGRASFRLACVWLRLVLVAIFVVRFQTLNRLHYWMLVFPGILSAVTDKSLIKWAENLFWLTLQIIGMLVTNLVCRFVLNMSGGAVFVMIYIAMGLFVTLFSAYLFLNELSSISAQRSLDPHSVWAEEEEETN